MKTQQAIQNYYLVKVMPYKLLTKIKKGQEMLSHIRKVHGSKT